MAITTVIFVEISGVGFRPSNTRYSYPGPRPKTRLQLLAFRGSCHPLGGARIVFSSRPPGPKISPWDPLWTRSRARQRPSPHLRFAQTGPYISGTQYSPAVGLKPSPPVHHSDSQST